MKGRVRRSLDPQNGMSHSVQQKCSRAVFWLEEEVCMAEQR